MARRTTANSALDGIERRRNHDLERPPAGFDRAGGDAVLRPRRGLRTGGQKPISLPYGQEIAVQLHFADHLARGGHHVAFHLLEFVGEEHGGGVGLRSQGLVQAGHQGSRELAV